MKLTFLKEFLKIQDEAFSYLTNLQQMLNLDSIRFYQKIGALGSFKGSGLSTVFAAIYLFLKYLEEPDTGLLEAVNMIGSDTDTISYFLGGLYGSYYGKNVIPDRFNAEIQDRDYILKMASRLCDISVGNISNNEEFISQDDKRRDFDLIKLWEYEMRDLFWDQIEPGCTIMHPIFGEGILQRKTEKETRREDYKVKLIDIHFKSGQSCSFHSRVNKDGNLSETLINDLRSNSTEEKNLFSFL